MRNALVWILLIVGIWAVAEEVAVCQVIVEVQNTLEEVRPDEVVTLDLADLGLGEGQIGLSVKDVSTGIPVLSQMWDEDSDGRPDQLLFLVSLWSGESRRFSIEANAAAEPMAGRAYAAYIPERDDVAWESDRIAFRTYGQGLWTNPDYDPLVSSGIDVWPKRTRALVIDRWYSAGHDAYHVDRGEGADFFSVGPTLGAGGTAVYINGALYRAANFKGHKIIAAGPIRAAFQLDYDPWVAGELTVSQTKRISIDAGTNLYREETVFHADTDQQIPFVVGFVKRKEGIVGSTKRAADWTWLSTWGPVERKNGGHGDLGSAVLLSSERVSGFSETEDHYLLVTYAQPGESVSYYVGSGWTASGDFETVEDWWEHLDRLARRLASPVEVRVIE